MGVIKTLWASIQGDPVFMRRVNGWFTIFWIVMIPISVVAGFLSSVSYVSALSLWALVSGHWSAWQASRVEVEQMAEAEELRKNPVEARVVAEMVDKTEINAANADGVQASRPPKIRSVGSDYQARLADSARQLSDLQRDLSDFDAAL